MNKLQEWLSDFWDWFWYFRRGKIKVTVFGHDGAFNATAFDGKTGVYNCYGTTPEAAREMALYRMPRGYEIDE